ncbi:DUF3618 domain-containing protein [Nonomuraea sp. NPDC050310]|uniref:DUF3618 domain-containing protein n=1 Tax=unclassified Nonomuraea TaxID=2593643 RepID=UPI0033E23818
MTESSGGEGPRVHAGDMGAHRATVGEPTDELSVNVPPTKPEALENARAAERAREPEEVFVAEPPVPDDRVGEQDTGEYRSARMDEQGRAKSHEHDAETMIVSHAPGGGSTRHAGTRADHHRAGDTTEADEARVRTEIVETRERVGETVEALTAKTDVKARLKEAAPANLHEAAEEVKKRPKLLVAAAGVVAALVIRKLLRRGRK